MPGVWWRTTGVAPATTEEPWRRAPFADFVAARGQAAQRTAYLFTGDWALAEDLLRTALARAYPRWDRIVRDDPRPPTCGG